MSHKYPRQVVLIGVLTVFAVSLVPYPVYQVDVKTNLNRTIDDAAALMYISDAILTDESELDDSPESTGMLSPIQDVSLEVDTKPLLSRIIHAKKMQRNDLDANCRLLKAYYVGQGKDCEAKEVNNYCQKTRAEINSLIGFYHKMRGDQRKFFTKMWHSVKRNSSNFWHKIGPLGRRILRSVGDEALQTAVSGGFSGGTLKNLLKQTAKSMGRDHLKQVLLQGVQRLLQGQIDIAAAAGVDICDEEDDETAQDETSAESETSDPSIVEIEIDTNWTCTSDTGPWGAWMQNGDPNTRIDLTELLFNLQTNPPKVTYEFSFHGLGGIPLYSAEGNFYDHLNTEEIDSGEGIAEWDETYFYGSVTINRESYLYYPSNIDEFKDSFDRAVIGALSPDQDQIQLCFHTHSQEQFDIIKKGSFDTFESHCTSGQFFTCTPLE